jgi:hypothetical protein
LCDAAELKKIMNQRSRKIELKKKKDEEVEKKK